jgi:hypothetical protein
LARADGIDRREFLKQTSLAAGTGALGLPSLAAAAAGRGVSLVLDPADGIASSAPARWAVSELQRVLAARHVPAQVRHSLDQVPPADIGILVAGIASPAAQELLKGSNTNVAAAPETLALVPSANAARPILLAGGSDARGLVYAVTELADRVHHGTEPVAALQIARPIVERPANVIRSIARCFESDVEDKSWFHDRDMWREYLSMLATNRFNRFSMTFGLQYNYPMEVSDVYLYFAYPFLFTVPGYGVRVRELSDDERARNLETLRFIGEETIRRGLEFQVGLWTHGYTYDSPNVNYHVEGLTSENHAPYCRDALAMLLEACPSISGITFRIHGESGIPEGDFGFWQTVFDGIRRAGRRVEIDMHAKGLDQKTIDVALATGMPVNVSPKYLAEHIGLPYHQTAIRDLERPPRQADSHFAFSEGSRRFTRYSYGDFLKDDRRHGILFRVWPGTQRVLLWGDPTFAAGYGRHASFCGCQGVELCEPFSFKGRMGSGRVGSRAGYADASLAPNYDWQKHAYTYRVWGRLTYNPDAEPETWRRYLATAYGAAAADGEAALARASRILPLITLAHGPSASNNSYWPEIYRNMPIVRDDLPRPYYDTPKPPRFAMVETFDPQMFSRMDEFAQEILSGEPSARYSPLDVAQWLDDLAGEAAQHLARATNAGRKDPEFRRLSVDVSIQCGIGRFFAAKFRSAVLWSLYERSGDRLAAEEAVKAYHAARQAWADAAVVGGVYVADISYGREPWLRGHWSDRLEAIDADIADMENRAAAGGVSPTGDQANVRNAIRQVLARPHRAAAISKHEPPAGFRPGAPLELAVSLPDDRGSSALLHYRRVNQAEAWQATEMSQRNDRRVAVIPGDYTSSPYPLQYYFEIRASSGALLFPGLAPDLSNQPYFVLRQI